MPFMPGTQPTPPPDNAALKEQFHRLFGPGRGTERVHVVRAPGRVNLIGEHTDYNDGFVMPVAIDFSTWVKVSPLEPRKLQIHSENFGQEIEVDLDDPNIAPRDHWSDYPVGVAVMLDRSGHR